jgi:hypothetical protein
MVVLVDVVVDVVVEVKCAVCSIAPYVLMVVDCTVPE